MTNLVAFSVFVALQLALQTGAELSDPAIQERIVGGKEVITRIPHQVALKVRLWSQENKEDVLCGGSLISEKFVLSTAQCLHKVTRPLYEVKVTAGGIFLNANVSDGETSPARNVIVHPQWDNLTLENDIAIVETFAFPIVPDMLEPIRLPAKRQAFWSFWMWSATTSGWGKLRSDESTNTVVLHSVESRILKNVYCKFRYAPELITDNKICTSGTDRKGLCEGDEGGPLFIIDKDKKPTLLGIASFKGYPGMVCETSLPSVFTRVTSFLDWIHEITAIPIRT